MKKPAFKRFGRVVFKPLVMAVLSLFGFGAKATDIEPRAYSNIPINTNFLVATYTNTSGSVSFSPSIPITNGKITINSALLAYVRSLNIGGQSGKIDIILPTASLSGSAEFMGQPHSRAAEGFADPIVRFYVNFFGAPALSTKDFAKYRQNMIVGASLAMTAPGGQYDSDKLVNLGTNRWSFKPELGISKSWGPFITEFAAGAYFFTENHDFLQGHYLQQDPLYTVQGHLIHNFGRGIWGAFDFNYYTGGQAATNIGSSGNRMENWRVGGTLALPINRRNSIKLFGSSGIYARTGSNFNIIGIAWQYRWGEGL